MLETHFAAPKALERLRAGPSGPYMDGFAASLKRDGYGAATAVRYLRAAAHLGHFLQSRGGTLAEIDLSAFFRHLRTCRCPRWKGGRRNHHTSFGAKRYRDYLVQIGVCRCSVAPEIQSADPALVDEHSRSRQRTARTGTPCGTPRPWRCVFGWRPEGWSRSRRCLSMFAASH
jgi:hypothetical protein